MTWLSALRWLSNRFHKGKLQNKLLWDRRQERLFAVGEPGNALWRWGGGHPACQRDVLTLPSALSVPVVCEEIVHNEQTDGRILNNGITL